MMIKRKLGAPKKAEGIKKDPDGFTRDQKARLRVEAKGQDITVAELKRRIAKWYFDALDLGELFDKTVVSNSK